MLQIIWCTKIYLFIQYSSPLFQVLEQQKNYIPLTHSENITIEKRNDTKINGKVSKLMGDDVIIIPLTLPQENKNGKDDTLSLWRKFQCVTSSCETKRQTTKSNILFALTGFTRNVLNLETRDYHEKLKRQIVLVRIKIIFCRRIKLSLP